MLTSVTITAPPPPPAPPLQQDNVSWQTERDDDEVDDDEDESVLFGKGRESTPGPGLRSPRWDQLGFGCSRRSVFLLLL